MELEDHTDAHLAALDELGDQCKRTSEFAVQQSLDLRLHLDQAMCSTWFIQECMATTDSIANKEVYSLEARFIAGIIASVKFALGGYYQSSLAQARDAQETAYLIIDFGRNPEHIPLWNSASSAKDRDFFKPVNLRKRLDTHEEVTGNHRAEIYSWLSTFGGHPTVEGTRLTWFKETQTAGLEPIYGLNRRPDVDDGQGEAPIILSPPFFEITYLHRCLEEAANIASHIALFCGRWSSLELGCPQHIEFIDRKSMWWGHFYGNQELLTPRDQQGR